MYHLEFCKEDVSLLTIYLFNYLYPCGFMNIYFIKENYNSYHHFLKKTPSSFLALHNTPGLSSIFPASSLESVIFPGSSGSLYWRMVFRK